MLTVVHDTDEANANDGGLGRSLLDEIVRDGARQMLAAALQAEVAAYIDAHASDVDENGRRLVVRNGSHREREVLTAAGAVTVTAQRVNDKRIDADTVERQRFSSVILPAWARKSPQMTEVLPLLYLHGLSTSDFGPALEQFLGSGAGLSATTITRLTAQWQDEAKTFQDRDLSGTDYVYLNRPVNAGGSDLGNEDGVMPKEQSPGKPTTRRYTSEERASAVRMVRALRDELGTDHGTVQRVARQLGYGIESVRSWVRQADIDDGHTPGVTTAEQQRIKQLERENRDLKEANEILKAAASFFGAELCATRRRVYREVVRDRLRWAVAAA